MPPSLGPPAPAGLCYNGGVSDYVVDKTAEFAPRSPRPQRVYSRIARFVIHHDAGPKPPRDEPGVLKRLHSYWKQHRGLLPYHYVISWGGTIYKCNPVSSVLPHARGANWDGIGIMLMGYFHPPYMESPTPAQIASLRVLLADLRLVYPHMPAVPHRAVPGSSTACPGDVGMTALKASGII